MAALDCFWLDAGDDFRNVLQATILSDLEIIDIGIYEESEIEIGNFGYQE